VISAGTSVRESVEIIRVNGATPCGVFIALDRQERGLGALSAVQEVERNYGIPVRSIASLEILIEYLHKQPAMSQNLLGLKNINMNTASQPEQKVLMHPLSIWIAAKPATGFWHRPGATRRCTAGQGRHPQVGG